MAQKTVILHVCDRCHHEQTRPHEMIIKVSVSAKKWKTWELCGPCSEGFSDYLVAGISEPHDNDGDLG